MKTIKNLWLFSILALSQINNANANIQSNDVNCLARNIFYEAGNQSRSGKIAVAHVTINRLRKNFAKSICQVVYQRNQFSWTKKRRLPSINNDIWLETKELAESILNGSIKSNIGGATRFHATYVHPGWKGKVAIIGDHIFYK